MTTDERERNMTENNRCIYCYKPLSTADFDGKCAECKQKEFTEFVKQRHEVEYQTYTSDKTELPCKLNVGLADDLKRWIELLKKEGINSKEIVLEEMEKEIMNEKN
jgi:phage FluMu protein Com